MKHKIFLLYDGIANSVFHSQVLAPLQKQLSNDKELSITIVSFERVCAQNLTLPSGLSLVTLKKFPFFGEPSLWPAVYQFKNLYKKLYDAHGVAELVARGPLAGWIAKKSVSLRRSPGRFVIQARGLAAEEFRYVSQKKTFRYFLYDQIECEAYAPAVFPTPIEIEAVSPALKNYLIQHFCVDPQRVTVARDDIPEHVARDRVQQWRREVRAECDIDADSYVYCYAGSAHPWQGVDEMIAFFTHRRREDRKSILLIVSQDEEIFKDKLKMLELGSYRIKKVAHTSVARYLSAADAGLLFRRRDPVNWVARPTKMLEYQSVGLKVIHNDTVAWLCNNDSETC